MLRDSSAPVFSALVVRVQSDSSLLGSLHSCARYVKLAIVTLAWCLFTQQLVSPVLAEDAVSFRNQIAPLLQDYCVACHGSKKAEGGYRANSFEVLKVAGDSGAAPIDAERVEQSELLRRLVTDDPSERMPAGAEPMKPAEIELVKRWLEQGAPCDAEPASATLFEIMPDPAYPASPATYPAPIPITAVLLSESGEEVFVGGYFEITKWRVADGALLQRFGNLGERVYRMAKSPVANELYVACGTPGKLGEVRVVRLDATAADRVIHRASDVVLDLAFSPDGKRLATTSADGLVRVYTVEPFALQATLSSHSDYVTAVAWSPDSMKLATASRDKTSKVFDAATGELLATCSLHQQAVRSVAFGPDGKQIVTCGSDYMLYRWDAENGNKISELGFGGEGYQASVDQGTIYFAVSDGQVKQLEVGQNRVARSFAGHRTGVFSISLSQASQRLASGSLDGEVRVWNLADGANIATITAIPRQ